MTPVRTFPIRLTRIGRKSSLASPGYLTTSTLTAPHRLPAAARTVLTDLLPDDTWLSCVGPPEHPREPAVARSVLFERISGLPASRAPFAAAFCDLARETGMSETTMKRSAYSLDIPSRGGGDPATNGTPGQIGSQIIELIFVLRFPGV